MRGICVVVALLVVGVPASGVAVADGPGRTFDLQAHRGGLGIVVENTLPAFANALELGVSTLELDVQITEDGFAVVTHDRDPSEDKCLDTLPAFLGDPEFPYVPGEKFIKDLTLAQVRTIDCGSKQLTEFPEQRTAPGARMPLLSEVFDLVHAYRAEDVRLNVETKVEADAPEQTAPQEQFVRTIVDEVRRAGLTSQVTIQSFAWSSLVLTHEIAPELELVALTSGQDVLQEGEPGASPWLGGLDIDDFSGTTQQKLVAAAASLGVAAVSPVHGDPQDGAVTDPGYVPFTNADLVSAAHARGLRVVPWTVDDADTMAALLDLGVDGIITDRPDILRGVLSDYGYQLPKPYRRQ
ncbi:glycerophosphodiester phosphodiesterase family protein [Nocardia callitridis]